MQIKTRLLVAAVLPAVFVLAVGTVLLVTDRRVDVARRHAAAADDIIQANNELNLLAQEYLLYGEERPLIQWQQRHATLGALLAVFGPVEPPERELLERLRQDHDDIASLFRQLTAVHPGPARADRRQRAASQLLIKSQTMRSQARQLADHYRQAVTAIRQQANLVIVASLIALAILGAGFLALLARSLNRSLQQLNEGAARIGGGDLRYAIAVTAADELGALAAAFNGMTRRLRESYASLDDLRREIGQRERAEQAMQRYAQELEAANQELESFSYSVSHDLRAPLRAIDGFSRILLEDYRDRLDDEGRRLLGVVRDNTRKMAQLIDDILAFSRTGRKELAFMELDMAELVRAVAAELAPTWAGRDLHIEVGGLPPARGDAAMFRQLWTNLLANAVKFTRPKPAATIEVGGRADAEEKVYFVRDNGAGFDMRYANKLFGVFQRLHGPDEFEGTGIGLAIVKRIVARHGGRVWAEGKVNEGASFFFALPK